MTGEGWSMLMYVMWYRFPPALVVSYFGLLILFGVFFVFNLFIAVLSESYVKIMTKGDKDEENRMRAKRKIY